MGRDAGLRLVRVNVDLIAALDQAGDLIEKRSHPEHRKEAREHRYAHSASNTETTRSISPSAAVSWKKELSVRFSRRGWKRFPLGSS